MGQERFESFVLLLTESSWLGSQSGEKTLRVFKKFFLNESSVKKMKDFHRVEMSLEGQKK